MWASGTLRDFEGIQQLIGARDSDRFSRRDRDIWIGFHFSYEFPIQFFIWTEAHNFKLSRPSILYPHDDETAVGIGESTAYLCRIVEFGQVKLEIVPIALGLPGSAKSVDRFIRPII